MIKDNETKFFTLLKDLFIGEKIEGDSAYVNLMKLKSLHFEKIENRIENELFGRKNKEEIYDKLYTFFHSFFDKSGGIMFANTPRWKNIYAKLSSKDVELFYKTRDLYYIKTQKVYNSMEIKLEDTTANFIFKFDVSDLGERKGNEKKEIEFYFVDYKKDDVNHFLTFKIKYKEKQNYDVLKDILGVKETKDIRKTLLSKNDAHIRIVKNFVYENRDKLKADDIDLLIEEIDKHSLMKEAKVEFVITKYKAIKKFIPKLKEELFEKAKRLYKKQSEIDYFIHKDAKAFLKEQFNLYMFNYINDEEVDFNQKRLDELKFLKKIADILIEEIALFEDELKRIYLKPRFVFDSNYVITKDRLEKYGVLDKFLTHSGIDKQIVEWRELKLVDEDFELSKINDEKYKYLPFDTKYFKEIEIDLLERIENFDDELDGRLIRSENFQALNTLLPKYRGSVDLVYIDPPFNTGSDFDYIDKFQDSTWLTLMDNRIRLTYELLSKRGSFYLHLDDNANIYGKLLLKNFYKNITEIIFDTNATKDEESDLFGYKSFGNDFVLKHQTIFFARNEDYKFNKLWKPNRSNTNLEIGQLDLIAKKNKEKPKKIKDFNFFIEIYENNNLIMKKIEINEKIFPIGDIWNDIYSFTQSEMRVSESLSFTSSQKPEHLLRRIIQASTDQQDIVLDFFAGIGTTASVSKKLNRKFISIEIGEHFNNIYTAEDKFSIATFERLDKDAIVEIISKNKNEVKCLVKKLGILGRLKWVLFGDKELILPDGRKRRPSLSKNINWQGGGFFKYYSLEQYEDILKKAEYKKTIKTSPLLGLKGIKIKENDAFYTFERVYPDKTIDLAETISNLFGEKIKKITKDKIYLETKEIDLNNLSFKKYPELKSLIYWGESYA